MADRIPEGWRTPRGRAAWAVRRPSDRIIGIVSDLADAVPEIEDSGLDGEDEAKLSRIREAFVILDTVAKVVEALASFLGERGRADA